MTLRTATLMISTATLLALLGAGCGGDVSAPGLASPTTLQSEPTASVDPTSENDFAESLLLTIADFPDDWVHEPAEPEDAEAPLAPFDVCIDVEFEGQTGSAIGGEFSDERTTGLSINPSVYVFVGAAEAEAAAEKIISGVQCLADLIGEGLDFDENFAMGRAYTEPLEAAAYEATAALRLYETLIYKSGEPRDDDILVFDLVIVVDGRVLYEVDGFQRGSPIDPSLHKVYVDKAREKIRQEP